MPRDSAKDKIEYFDRKSVSGCFLLTGGCKLHSHSRTTNQHAFSSGESEIRAMSELLQEAKQLQYNLELCGCGRIEIVLHADADVPWQLAHKRGVSKNEAFGREALLAARRFGTTSVQSRTC